MRGGVLEPVAVDSVALGHGVDLHCAMHSREGSLEVGLSHQGEHLGSAVLQAAAPRHGFRISTGLIGADLELGFDHLTGEVFASGHLRIADHPLLRFDKHVLTCISPCNGMVGSDPAPHPPVVQSRRFGSSRPYAAHITRIFVDERPRHLTDVGTRVKRVMFGEHPPFVFNTVACVGADRPTHEHPGYVDPMSHWFNVFVGYYQIDAAKREWGRPFGYRSAAGPRAETDFHDLALLGRSDWNWFANWMYGVPEEHVLECCELGVEGLEVTRSEAVQLGERRWHVVGVDNLRFVSAYESGHPGAERLHHNSPLTWAWRRCYGPPVPRAEFQDSFVSTLMSTRLFTSYWEDEEHFHTVMFGAAARREQNPQFLDDQLAAVRLVIEGAYPNLGFPADGISAARNPPASPAGAVD